MSSAVSLSRLSLRSLTLRPTTSSPPLSPSAATNCNNNNRTRNQKHEQLMNPNGYSNLILNSSVCMHHQPLHFSVLYDALFHKLARSRHRSYHPSTATFTNAVTHASHHHQVAFNSLHSLLFLLFKYPVSSTLQTFILHYFLPHTTTNQAILHFANPKYLIVTHFLNAIHTCPTRVPYQLRHSVTNLYSPDKFQRISLFISILSFYSTFLSLSSILIKPTPANTPANTPATPTSAPKSITFTTKTIHPNKQHQHQHQHQDDSSSNLNCSPPCAPASVRSFTTLSSSTANSKHLYSKHFNLNLTNPNMNLKSASSLSLSLSPSSNNFRKYKSNSTPTPSSSPSHSSSSSSSSSTANISDLLKLRMSLFATNCLQQKYWLQHVAHGHTKAMQLQHMKRSMGFVPNYIAHMSSTLQRSVFMYVLLDLLACAKHTEQNQSQSQSEIESESESEECESESESERQVIRPLVKHLCVYILAKTNENVTLMSHFAYVATMKRAEYRHFLISMDVNYLRTLYHAFSSQRKKSKSKLNNRNTKSKSKSNVQSSNSTHTRVIDNNSNNNNNNNNNDHVNITHPPASTVSSTSTSSSALSYLTKCTRHNSSHASDAQRSTPRRKRRNIFNELGKKTFSKHSHQNAATSSKLKVKHKHKHKHKHEEHMKVEKLRIRANQIDELSDSISTRTTSTQQQVNHDQIMDEPSTFSCRKESGVMMIPTSFDISEDDPAVPDVHGLNTIEDGEFNDAMSSSSMSLQNLGVGISIGGSGCNTKRSPPGHQYDDSLFESYEEWADEQALVALDEEGERKYSLNVESNEGVLSSVSTSTLIMDDEEDDIEDEIETVRPTAEEEEEQEEEEKDESDEAEEMLIGSSIFSEKEVMALVLMHELCSVWRYKNVSNPFINCMSRTSSSTTNNNNNNGNNNGTNKRVLPSSFPAYCSSSSSASSSSMMDDDDVDSEDDKSKVVSKELIDDLNDVYTTEEMTDVACIVSAFHLLDKWMACTSGKAAEGGGEMEVEMRQFMKSEMGKKLGIANTGQRYTKSEFSEGLRGECRSLNLPKHAVIHRAYRHF